MMFGLFTTKDVVEITLGPLTAFVSDNWAFLYDHDARPSVGRVLRGAWAVTDRAASVAMCKDIMRRRMGV